MKKWLIGVLVGVGAAALGVGGAFAYNAAVPAAQLVQAPSSQPRFSQQFPAWPGQGNQGQNQALPNDRFQNRMPGGMGRGMNSNLYNNGAAANAQKITLDEAYTRAQSYITSTNADLKIAEIMEFSNNFYVTVVESSTGRGAMELLIDPYSGQVSREPGPDMMWNLKYGGMGMMNSATGTDSTLTIDQARTAAQQALDATGQGAVLNDGGYSFYGYYSFDYSISGQVSGMLSVNGLTGQVWFHTWHGSFISEKEYGE